MALQHLTWICVAILVVCPAPQIATAAPIDELIPADVALALVTDDLSATASAWERTRWGEALSGQMFAPLRSDLRSRNLPAPLHLRPWFGIDWAELAAHRGPAAFVVYGNEKVTHSAWLFPAGAREQPEAMLTAMSRYFTENRGSRSGETAAGLRTVWFSPPAGAKTAHSPAYFESDRMYGVASSREAVKALVEKQRAREFKPLGTLPEYRDTAARATEPAAAHRVRLWARPLPLWTLMQSREGRKPRPDWRAIAGRQGFDAVQSVSGVAAFATTGASEIDLVANVSVASPLTKAARLLEMQPGPAAEIPSWLVPDFARLTMWQCDFTPAIKAFGQIFDELAEPGPSGQGLFEDLLDGLRDDPEGPRVDLRREVFQHLGPQLLSVVDRPVSADSAKTEADAKSRSLLVIQCRDRAAVTAALTRFYKSDTEVRPGKLGNDPLWTIGPGKSLFVEGGGDSLVPIRAILVTDTAMLVASHPEMISNRVQQGAETAHENSGALRAWSDWQSAAATDETCFRRLVLEAPWLEGPYAQVKSGNATEKEDWQTRGLRFLLWGSTSTQPIANSSALPTWNDVRSALFVSGLTLDRSSTGFVLRGSVLRRANSAR